MTGIVRCSPGDVNYAWPTAEIAVMGPNGAANIIHRGTLAEAADPEARRAELVANYRETFGNPFRAAVLGYIDAVIHPGETPKRLIRSLEMLKDKVDTNPPEKHGNIPL